MRIQSSDKYVRIECFVKMVNGLKPLPIFAKCSILDVRQVSEQAFHHICRILRNIPQSDSSDPSLQSSTPSHFFDLLIHCLRSWHSNCRVGQLTLARKRWRYTWKQFRWLQFIPGKNLDWEKKFPFILEKQLKQADVLIFHLLNNYLALQYINNYQNALSPHPFSSLSSAQSLVPSHFHNARIQSPSLHCQCSGSHVGCGIVTFLHILSSVLSWQSFFPLHTNVTGIQLPSAHLYSPWWQCFAK